ncbi:hypothetical protein DIPPA_33037 [Diplonema papillatum]|nr:hypothetical protein DIPPA_33037 [Diplonema papillatum]
MYASHRELNRSKADTLLDAQRHANIDQLAEVYPKLDKEVIRGVVQETNGDQEKYHVTLAELSGNDMTAETRRNTYRWVVGQAVEANFQGLWHPATIQSIEPSGDFNVRWTEDGSHTLVTPNQIRAASIAVYQ